MLVSEDDLRHNRRLAIVAAGLVAALGLGLMLVWPWWGLLIPVAALIFVVMRRRALRRWTVAHEPFPDAWEQILKTEVEYYRALNPQQRQRFQQLVQVFLDEVRITGVRIEVDDLTRVLVAASAVIPIFGFEHWEYARLGEVLIYPNAFDEGYQTDPEHDRTTLGMVGDGHLSGVMILSRPDLISGFRNTTDKRNVGIHEFAHLVDKADGAIDGSPPGIDSSVSQPWVEWVANELKSEKGVNAHINDYAYTNEAEYFAVLSEYFFETPELLQRKDPQLYAYLQKMYHQNPRRLLAGVPKRPRRVGRNSPCPCGSGEKYKRCCMRQHRRRK